MHKPSAEAIKTFRDGNAAKVEAVVDLNDVADEGLPEINVSDSEREDVRRAELDAGKAAGSEREEVGKTGGGGAPAGGALLGGGAAAAVAAARRW